MVLDQGYAYEGETYLSLSEIAREITGTRWNGPRFFGLRANRPAIVEDLSRDSGNSLEVPLRRRRGRPRKPVQHADSQGPMLEDRRGL